MKNGGCAAPPPGAGTKCRDIPLWGCRGDKNEKRTVKPSLEKGGCAAPPPGAGTKCRDIPLWGCRGVKTKKGR